VNLRVLVGLVVIAAPACVTSGEGERMRTDINRLRERMETMETRDTEINEQVARLRKVLDQATDLLSRNSADIGTKVAKTETDLAALTGQIEEAKHVAEQLQKRLDDSDRRLMAMEQVQGKIVERVAPTIPEDKETLWREAQSRLAGGMRDDARRFLAGFIHRFPQDQRVPQANVQIGESLMADGRHSQALSYFHKVITSHGSSPVVPDAMWLLAQSFIELKFCLDAKQFLTDLAKRYPRSPRAAEARNRLKDLQRMLKDRRVCTP
jgi:TolA-binding protein